MDFFVVDRFFMSLFSFSICLRFRLHSLDNSIEKEEKKKKKWRSLFRLLPLINLFSKYLPAAVFTFKMLVLVQRCELGFVGNTNKVLD